MQQESLKYDNNTLYINTIQNSTGKGMRQLSDKIYNNGPKPVQSAANILNGGISFEGTMSSQKTNFNNNDKLGNESISYLF